MITELEDLGEGINVNKDIVGVGEGGLYERGGLAAVLEGRILMGWKAGVQAGETA